MDVRSLVLADVLTLPLIPAGLLVAAVVAPSHFLWHAVAALAGFALMVAVAYAYRRLRGREGLGFGDAKLMAAAGAWVSLEGIGSVLLYAAASGLAYATVMRMTGKSLAADAEIPLGAGIALGLWLVWLYGPLFFAQ
jgi:leader peptidase (prepilin peptidase)/N-methyltransferase